MMQFVQTFLSICGAISIVGGAGAIIYRWISPAMRLNKRVDTLEDHDRRDYAALNKMAEKMAERDALVLEALITILDCQIAGPENGKEQLKKTREKLVSYLAQK